MFNRRQIGLAHWLAWMEQWGALIESGMPTLDALKLSSALLGNAPQERKLKGALNQTASALEAGRPLSQAFLSANLNTPECLRLALLCSESTGDLSKALAQQCQQAKHNLLAYSTLAKSLAYPCLVLLLSVCCFFFLQHFAKQNGIAQPSTALALGDWLLLLGLLCIPFLLAQHKKSSKSPPNHMGALSKHMGLILPSGPNKVSNFLFVMACQIEAGIDLMQVLKQGHTDTNTRRKKAKRLDRELMRFKHVLAQSLINGMGFQRAIAATQAPEFLVSQAKIAEQTGRIDTCFFLASKVFALQATKRQERLQTWLGPMTLLVAAGILVYAYYSAIGPLYANLGGL